MDSELLQHRRSELGSFLRLKRAGLRPEDIGLPPIGRRHVKGLRREELAEAAGIGASWYALVEQGRAPNLSARALGALAETLRLSERERLHVFALADRTERPRPSQEAANPALAALVRRHGSGIALLFDPQLDVIAWNAGAAEYFEFPQRPGPGRRNAFEMLVRDERLRGAFVDPCATGVLASLIGHYRATLAKYPSHRSRHVEALEREDPAFAALWQKRVICDPPAGTFHLRSRQGTVSAFQATSFAPFEAPACTLTILAAAQA
jgi:transcriptional regulator with XRE-family HTH domain